MATKVKVDGYGKIKVEYDGYGNVSLVLKGEQADKRGEFWGNVNNLVKVESLLTLSDVQNLIAALKKEAGLD